MVLHNLSLGLFVIAAILRVQESARAAESVCGSEVSDADVGVLELAEEFLYRNACTWTVVAAAGRHLLVTVDDLQLNGNETLEVMADGNGTVFSGRCVKCLPNLVGRTIMVTYKDGGSGNGALLTVSPSSNWTSARDSNAANGTRSTRLPGRPYFLINYVSFDPLRCEPPTVPKNVLVVRTGTAEVGTQTLYQCRTPYLPEKGASSKATCVLNTTRSVPSWSHPPPRCVLPECGKTPIRITLDDEMDTTVLHSANVRLIKAKSCVWEIATGRKNHLVVSVDHVGLPKWSAVGRQPRGAVLELYDGKVSDRQLLTSLTGRFAGGATAVERNFTTIYNKLIVVLRIGSFGRFTVASNDPTDETEGKSGGYGFRLTVSSKVPLCEVPSPPPFGDVKGWIPPVDVATKADASWTMVYSCNAGYYLNGSDLVACLDSGKWNHDFPVCLPLPSSMEIGAVPDHKNISATEDDSFVHEKSPLSRQFQNRRPHPQSTDEKTNFKVGHDELDYSTQQLLPLTPSFQATLDNATGVLHEEDAEEDRMAAGSSGDVLDYPSEEDEFDDGFAGYPDDNGDYVSDKDTAVYNESNTGGQDFPVIPVILGVGLPLILGIVILSGCLVYRKLYPVRMGIGRKFDTFENPVYEQNKRGPTTPGGTLLPGVSLAQSPAELQRLTLHTS